MAFFELVDLGSVQHGVVITLQGRVTHVERDPRSDTIVSTDYFHISDGTRSARVLMLDPQAFNLHVGSEVMVHRILCTRTSANTMLHLFASSDTTITENSISQVTRSNSQATRSNSEANWSQATRPNSHPLRPSPTCCATPHAPFCSQTGRPHKTKCNICENFLDSSPFCSMTGIAHIP